MTGKETEAWRGDTVLAGVKTEHVSAWGPRLRPPAAEGRVLTVTCTARQVGGGMTALTHRLRGDNVAGRLQAPHWAPVAQGQPCSGQRRQRGQARDQAAA